MGVSSSKDVVEAAAHRNLDISRQLTPLQYKKHINGECLEGCLLDLPWEMYYNTVSLYQTVDASFNFIGSLPSELSLHIPHLRHLDLSHNQLTGLPHTFQLLLHLRYLSLAYNRFKQFPSGAIFKLPHLSSFDISHNSLRELPQQGWHQLIELERLNLSHNQLHLLPCNLPLCGQLTVLVVKGNPLMHPPAHICSEGSTAILHYLRTQMPSEKLLPSVAAARSPVFRRVRGDHVSASVQNPESAWRQYQQGSYTGPGKKRKCPLMPPKDAAALPPHKITQALLGLVYGAAVAEAVGLSCEGLSSCEANFYYSAATIAPHTRLRDFLRSHYPKDDWGPMADLMLTTLESVLRWGGVVDELEWAAQVHQWTVQGLPEVDDRPGHPISPLLTAVFESKSYAVSPYVSSDAVYQRLTSELSAASIRQGIVSDSFTVTKSSKGGDAGSSGDEEPPLHPNDNSCLPPALVLGLPSFSQLGEVSSNADRICRATHASPCARSAAVLTASVVASILQGCFEGKTGSTAAVEQILDDLFSSAVKSMPDSLEKATLVKLWSGDLLPREANLPSSHVAFTLTSLKKSVISYCCAVFGQRSRESSVELEGTTDDVSRQTVLPQSVSRLVSENAMPQASSLNEEASGLSSNKNLAESTRENSGIRDKLDAGVPLGANNETGEVLSKVPPERSVVQKANILNTSASFSKEASGVFRRIVSQVCMEGGWGVCAQSCVIGGVLGALGGFDALPTDWIQTLPASNRRYLCSKVNLLLDLFGLP
ncbi:Leucine-rich repeat [Trinorchestia longiramus]|nr:Leucine-rich repeat [Trinorchestia longiramus]